MKDTSGLTVEGLQEYYDEACLAVLNNRFFCIVFVFVLFVVVDIEYHYETSLAVLNNSLLLFLLSLLLLLLILSIL